MKNRISKTKPQKQTSCILKLNVTVGGDQWETFARRARNLELTHDELAAAIVRAEEKAVTA